MPLPQRVNCEYCNVPNILSAKNCIACGAPLPDKPPLVQQPQTAYRRKNTSQLIASSKDLETVRKVGEKADKAFWTGAYFYSAFLRALAELLTISVVGFATGFLGGATDMPVGGLVGAMLIGLVSGIVIKTSLFTYISAPTGFLVGALLCVVLWFFKFPPQGMVFITTALVVIAILIGRVKQKFSQRNLWEKLRPFLVAIGGLVIGAIGMAVGLGLRTALMALLEQI